MAQYLRVAQLSWQASRLEADFAPAHALLLYEEAKAVAEAGDLRRSLDALLITSAAEAMNTARLTLATDPSTGTDGAGRAKVDGRSSDRPGRGARGLGRRLDRWRSEQAPREFPGQIRGHRLASCPHQPQQGNAELGAELGRTTRRNASSKFFSAPSCFIAAVPSSAKRPLTSL